jgi:hypothetical protein
VEFRLLMGVTRSARIRSPACAARMTAARYHVHELIEKYGRNGKWLTELKLDCLKREAFQLHDRCDLYVLICRRSCDGLRAANVCNIPLTDPPQSDIMRCAPGP